MTKEQLLGKVKESEKTIKNGLGLIENVRAQVYQERGKLQVYAEMLKALEAPPEPAPGPQAVEEP